MHAWFGDAGYPATHRTLWLMMKTSGRWWEFGVCTGKSKIRDGVGETTKAAEERVHRTC